MGKNSQRIPNVLQQPPSVDFIQNKLPSIDPAFKGFENLQYDQALNRFVPAGSDPAIMPSTQQSWHQQAMDQCLGVPVRQLVPAVSAMTFWDKILDKAMAKFKLDNVNVPEKIEKKPDYAIRNLDSWTEIYKRLQDAKDVYNGTKSKVWGRTKKGYRFLADKSDVLKQTAGILPDGTYVTPVKTAIEVLVDIVQTGANFRELVKKTFREDELEKIFAKMEIYLATFPGDENIEGASIALIVCILKAVELAIAFFLSSTLSRALHLLPTYMVGEYMKELADSISDIPQKIQDVIDTANESHIVGTQRAMGLSLEVIEQLLLLELETGDKTKIIATKADYIIEQGGKMMLELNSLKGEIQAQFRQHTSIIELRLEITKVEIVNEFKELFDGLENNLDAIRKQIQALKEASRPPTPVPQQQPQLAPYPSQWPSAHLQPAWQPWTRPYPYHYSQPNVQQYPESQWSSPAPLAEPTIRVDGLLEALNISNLDKEDIQQILDSSESVPLKYRLRARQLVRTDEFRNWATTPESRELLVQRDPRLRDPVQARHAVSLVAASLMEALRSRERFVSLVFFCRRHTDSDDVCAGPAAMVRSFIAQLLEQSYQGYSFLRSDMDLDGVRAGNVSVLCALLEWLVAYLPEKKKTTLVCVVDGVDAYENQEEGTDLRTVMDSLMGLARGEDPDRVVKVLATSPMGTVSIDEAFKNDPSSFLSMERLEIVSDAVGALEFDGEL